MPSAPSDHRPPAPWADSTVQQPRSETTFLAMMSHELRTPLNAIIGSTDLLLETRLDDTQRIHAKTTQSSALILLSLINDLLELSRIEAGRVELDAIPFKPRRILDEVTRMLQARAQSKGLALQMMVERDVPTSFLGDPRRLQQVLVNLVGNAIKFSPPGNQVYLSVQKYPQTSSKTASETQYALFCVQDSG
ncbi:MAG: histidine kinase dimerization/phospho-acceptor domain-containing protein, partial [Myxococcota bacterium]